jgi:hypothetical protein
MATYVYPTQTELQRIERILAPRMEADRLGLQLMPTRTVDSHLVSWEQLDNFYGLQQVRGLGGQPARVKKLGGRRYQMEPGVYGEFIDLDEVEITARRQYGTFNQLVDVTDLTMLAQQQLLQRRLDRVEYIIWALLIAKTFSVLGPSGSVLHSDSFTGHTTAASIGWATVGTATPLANFRSIQQLGPPRGVNFGGGAWAYMNRFTFNLMMANTNASDLGGRRLSGLRPVNNINDLNEILTGDDLPNIRIYDEGYLAVSATGDENPPTNANSPYGSSGFTRFIPNNNVLVVGQRPAGQIIGEYRYTRNANNPGIAPGPYMKTIDRGENEVPRRIEVHDGHNGGPALFYPGALELLTVG